MEAKNIRDARERLRQHELADPWWTSPYALHDQSNWMINGIDLGRDRKIVREADAAIDSLPEEGEA